MVYTKVEAKMTIEEMKSKLKSSLTEKRYVHSIGVMDTAVKMACKWGADTEKTAIAALSEPDTD